MNRIFLLLLQILTINFCVTGQVDDTLTLTYSEYIKQNINGDYLILDIYGEPFKMVTIKDSLIVKEQIYVDSSLIYVDTTIMIGFNKNRININDKDNVSLIFKYSDYYLNPPKFESSDGDTVIFSFLLDENGKLISIKILKDVTKKCKDDSKWEIKYNESIKFNPTIINGKKYKVNYVIQSRKVCYCLCTTVTKEYNKSTKKRWRKQEKNRRAITHV